MHLQKQQDTFSLTCFSDCVNGLYPVEQCRINSKQLEVRLSTYGIKLIGYNPKLYTLWKQSVICSLFSFRYEYYPGK